MISAVTAASSATGKSLVPAQIMPMVPGRSGLKFFLDGHATGGSWWTASLEFLRNARAWAFGDTRDEHTRFGGQDFSRRFFDDLFGRFAAAEMTSGKPLRSARAVSTRAKPRSATGAA